MLEFRNGVLFVFRSVGFLCLGCLRFRVIMREFCEVVSWSVEVLGIFAIGL